MQKTMVILSGIVVLLALGCGFTLQSRAVREVGNVRLSTKLQRIVRRAMRRSER